LTATHTLIRSPINPNHIETSDVSRDDSAIRNRAFLESLC
jgi:hypothetical protein